MPGSNQFKAIATSGGANALTPTAYAALTTLLANGYQSGTASSQQVNTTLRQSSFVAAAIAQAMADTLGAAINDDGVIANFEAQFLATMAAVASPGASIASSGYQKLPSGLILQWGLGGTLAANGASGTSNSFPISFPSVCHHIIASDSGVSAYVISASPASVSAMTAWARDASASGGFSNSAFRYLAIGK